jgi:hypothetical protein
MEVVEDVWSKWSVGTVEDDKEEILKRFKGVEVKSIRLLPCSEARAVGYLGGYFQYRVRYIAKN